MQTSQLRRQLRPLGWALLMRHKDANQSVDAPQGCNLHLTKKRGTGFQKAAQYPEQSNQSQYICLSRKQTFKPAVDREVRLASKSSSVS